MPRKLYDQEMKTADEWEKEPPTTTHDFTQLIRLIQWCSTTADAEKEEMTSITSDYRRTIQFAQAEEKRLRGVLEEAMLRLGDLTTKTDAGDAYISYREKTSWPDDHLLEQFAKENFGHQAYDVTIRAASVPKRTLDALIAKLTPSQHKLTLSKAALKTLMMKKNKYVEGYNVDRQPTLSVKPKETN